MPRPISRLSGHFRNQLVMTADTAGPLQRVLLAVREDTKAPGAKEIGSRY